MCTGSPCRLQELQGMPASICVADCVVTLTSLSLKLSFNPPPDPRSMPTAPAPLVEEPRQNTWANSICCTWALVAVTQLVTQFSTNTLLTSVRSWDTPRS